jgi:hypothetical protein
MCLNADICRNADRRALSHGEGYTLSMAKRVLSGRMDTVIKTLERNIRLL